MSEQLQPGEIAMEPDAPPAADPPANDTPAADVPVADVAAAADTPADTPAADEPPPPEPEADRRYKGAVRELIEKRHEAKLLRDELADLRRQVTDGRLVQAPPQVNGEQEQQRIAGVAERFGLYKVDAQGNQTLDLDAAKRVDSGIRDIVREEVAPVRHMSLSEKASVNAQKAIDYATANPHLADPEVVRDVFMDVLSKPNGAEMLSQREVAEVMWERAVGRTHTLGRAKPAVAVAGNGKPPVQGKPAPVVTDPPGRRNGGSASLNLTPAAERVWKDHGINLTTAATKTANYNPTAPFAFEE